MLRFKARSTPMRACISGPRSSAAIKSAFIAESANQDFGFAFRPSSTSQRITIRAAAANAMQQ
jgi:hypothetical protein